MNHTRGVLVVSSFGLVLAIGLPACGQMIVHPAPAPSVISVTVTESRHAKHGSDQNFVIAQAAGFPNDTCDVITTFDVVKTYEARQTWNNVKQRIDIVVDGTSYPAKLRDVGFYPLGLNLACIDFESPATRAQLRLQALPLEEGPRDPSTLAYDDKEIANSHPGTPFLNSRGEVSSVLIAEPFGPMEFAGAEQVRMFLAAAAGMSPWPTLRQRSLLSV